LIALWGHILGSAIIRWLPRGWWYRVADVLVPLALLGWPGHVRRATSNLRRVLGPDASEAEVQRRSRAIFRNYARYMIDLLWLPDASRAEREQVVTVLGWDHIPAALVRGRGLLLVSGHLGNWDLPAAVLAGRGYPTNVIVETLEPPAWNERVQAIRERVGLRAIPMETGVREIFAALRRNEVVAVVFDRPLATGGVAVDFFGHTARVPEGVARIALRTGAPVIGAVGIRRGARFVVPVSTPFEYAASGDRERDVQAITQQLIAWFEGQVRHYPDQWFMFRTFWPGASASADA
jgi:KDO2-lipid IV(A) lauroyltransferase